MHVLSLLVGNEISHLLEDIGVDTTAHSLVGCNWAEKVLGVALLLGTGASLHVGITQTTLENHVDGVGSVVLTK